MSLPVGGHCGTAVAAKGDGVGEVACVSRRTRHGVQMVCPGGCEAVKGVLARLQLPVGLWAESPPAMENRCVLFPNSSLSSLGVLFLLGVLSLTHPLACFIIVYSFFPKLYCGA